jgi:hypothetical protein
MQSRIFPAGAIALTLVLTAAANAQVGRTTQPPLLLSRYHVLLSARAGSTTASSAAIPWTSTDGPVDSLRSSIITSSGGEWLTSEPSTTPSYRPKAIRLSANPSGLEAGEYRASVTLTAEGRDYPPVTVEVTFVVWNNSGSQIYALST